MVVGGGRNELAKLQNNTQLTTVKIAYLFQKFTERFADNCGTLEAAGDATHVTSEFFNGESAEALLI